MVLETPTLYPEVQEVRALPGKGLHGYYRKANGWISTGPTTPSNRSDYEYKGFTFLSKYGQFKNVNDVTHEVDMRSVPWNSYTEPWRRLFQQGGAKEFPIDQIVAFRWHIKPPYREVKFPQLEGVDITDYPCPECTRFVAASLEQQDAARQLRAHLTSKIDERHKYTVTDLRELGKDWEIDFETSRTRRGLKRESVKGIEPEEGVMLTEPDQGSLNLEYKCTDCDWAPPITSKAPANALRFHRRRHGA